MHILAIKTKNIGQFQILDKDKMSLVKKLFLISLVTLCAWSCAPKVTNLQILSAQESELRNRRNYHSYLALEYLEFARELSTIKHLEESEYFAKKGINASAQFNLVPENPAHWHADPMQIEEMVMMQKRMELAAATPYIKRQMPIQFAHLFYLYDCWISRESKRIFISDELAHCRVRYEKLLDEIEGYIDDLKKDKTPKVKIKQPKFHRSLILFDFDSYKLNKRAFKDLTKTLKYLLKINGNYRLLLVGSADRVGKKLYNQNLALKRVEVVKRYLQKNGVPSDLIELRSFGEDFPDIVTKNGSQEQSNRTVGIYMARGIPSFEAYPLPLIENSIYFDAIKKARRDRGLDN